MKSPHEKLRNIPSAMSLRDAKLYLMKCAEGAYPSSYYHKRKCKKILDVFGDWLYESDTFLHDTATAMIENNKGI